MRALGPEKEGTEMQIDSPESDPLNTEGVKPTSLERLKTAQKRLSRLLEELTQFQEDLEEIGEDLGSLPRPERSEEMPPQSVKRSDAPVVEAPEGGAENE